MEYQEALVKLHQLTRMGISPGLERIEELTRRLGFLRVSYLAVFIYQALMARAQ